MTSPMTPHLEKIARALVRERHKFCCKNRDFSTYTLSDFDINEARGCIAALLPPSEEMVEAMATAIAGTFECSVCGCDVPDCGCGHEKWQEASAFKKSRAAFTTAIKTILEGGEAE